MSDMLDEHTETPVRPLIEENRTLSRRISALSTEIGEAKKKMRENDKKIWKACKHQWIYDMSCGPYDRTRHQCSQCGLWRNPYWYE